MKKFILKHIMPVFALALIGGSYVLMSFGTTAGKAVDLYWYKEDNGSWTLDNIGEEPMASCEGGSPEICAKGFETDPGAENVESTPTPHQRFYPN